MHITDERRQLKKTKSTPSLKNPNHQRREKLAKSINWDILLNVDLQIFSPRQPPTPCIQDDYEKERKRKEVVNEILKSEKEYVDGLNFLNKVRKKKCVN